MNLPTAPKILQIIAAQPGWKAVYGLCGERQVGIAHRGVVCWALVEPVGPQGVTYTEVRGVVQNGSDLQVVGDGLAPEAAAADDGQATRWFLGYNGPEGHRESDYWIDLANARFRAVRKHSSETND